VVQIKAALSALGNVTSIRFGFKNRFAFVVFESPAVAEKVLADSRGTFRLLLRAAPTCVLSFWDTSPPCLTVLCVRVQVRCPSTAPT
jgi:hypothetical protein